MSVSLPTDLAMAARRPSPLPVAIAVVAAVLATAGPATATQELPVVVVPGLELTDVAALGDRAAIGLVVPGAGPRVTEASALAALERGAVRNSLRGGLPRGPTLIEVDTAPALPDGPAIVLGLPEGGDQPNDRRYPIAVLAPGFEGLLTSSRTRVPGIVSIVDVAPTALGEPGGLSSRPDADPEETLDALDERIDANGDVRPLASLLAGLLILVLAFTFPRAAVLAFATALAVNLVLGAAGVSEPWLVLLAVALAVGLGAPALAALSDSPLVVGLLLAAVVAGYFVALLVDGPAVSLSPFGPTQNSRFYGLSNLLSAMLLVPALAGAGLLRITVGWAPALLLAALALVGIAGSRFGADGGTGIVLCVAYAVLAVELAEARRRAVVVAIAVAAVAGAAVLAIDAATGTSSHLTDAIGGGAGSFAADLRDRVVLSWERATERWYLIALVAVGAVLLALLVARLRSSELPRYLRGIPLSLAVAVAVSLLVNDSPLDVVAVGLVAYLAAQAYVSRDPGLAGFR
jgi:hypothetical protein